MLGRGASLFSRDLGLCSCYSGLFLLFLRIESLEFISRSFLPIDSGLLGQRNPVGVVVVWVCWSICRLRYFETGEKLWHGTSLSTTAVVFKDVPCRNFSPVSSPENSAIFSLHSADSQEAIFSLQSADSRVHEKPVITTMNSRNAVRVLTSMNSSIHRCTFD